MTELTITLDDEAAHQLAFLAENAEVDNGEDASETEVAEMLLEQAVLDVYTNTLR